MVVQSEDVADLQEILRNVHQRAVGHVVNVEDLIEGHADARND